MKTNDSETQYRLKADGNIDVDFYIRKAHQERNKFIAEISMNAIKSVLSLGSSIVAFFKLPRVA